MTNASSSPSLAALRLTVYNHPGVMTHICGMFARRAFNVESIFVMPIAGTNTSRVWMLVNNDQRLEQMIRQTRKLHDVIDLVQWEDGETAFKRFTAFMDAWEDAAPAAQ